MKKSSVRRRLLLGGAIGALLVVLYAAAGYWFAPGYVREALADAAARNGLTLGVTTVRTRPFALAVEFEDLTLYDRDGRTFAQAKSAAADLAWASLWRRGWIVQEVRIDAPQAALVGLPAGEAAPAGEPVAITIQNLVVENGTLRYAPRDLELQAFTLRARDLSTLDAAAGTYEAAARLADGGQLASRGTLALAPLAAEGTLEIAALRAARLLPEARGQLRGSARFVFAASQLELREVSISGEDLAYAGIELPRATLSAPRVPLPPAQPVEVAAQASVAPQGTIAAQGRVGFAPLELHLNLSAEDLPLAEAQRWLPPGVALRLVSGALSGTGLLDVSQGAVSYEGSARVGGLRVEERDSGTLLLAWKEAETAALRFESAPLTIAAGEIVARAPEGRLVIGRDGSVNFAQAFGGAGGHDGTKDDEGARVSVERLRIEAGTLHFADRSLETPFEATIGGLSGTVAGFSTAANDPAQVRLNGRVQPYGVARIRGTINLNAPTALADITAVFRNLRLEAFNPYVAKFAGYRIESGRLSAELRYQVREGRLVGSNQLTLRDMRLGEKLEDQGLLDLPLELAVALLADSQGRIELAIPVRGNLSDPQFDMGAIVARALSNVLKRIVSAPFRALARLFGGDDGEDPGAIGFAPGSARLSPPAEENVARVAQGLAERPQAGVEVRGGYDAARDTEALRLRAARQDLASAAGVQAPIDLSDPKVLRAAEQLYLQRGGERAALEALRKSEAGYGRALLERLAATVPLEDNAARALARERAETVRAALLEHGLDPARVGIGEARESSGEQQVATSLSLKPVDQVSAAGATAPAARNDIPSNLREVQGRLNAAGYDAGPADGILGPRTRRALLRFQAANKIEPSGAVDAATLLRLAS